jgi:hypothetical protein
MRRTFNILLLLSAYLLFCSKSCNENKRGPKQDSDRQALEQDSLQRLLLSEDLSPELLRDAEVRARQKLTDFSDYLAIIADTTINDTFRSKSADLARRLFISDRVSIILTGKEDKNTIQLTPEEFTNIQRLNKLCKIVPKVTGINTETPLQKVNDTLFTGNLGFEWFSPGKEEGTGLFLSSHKGNAAFHMARISKNFGTKKLKVWQVFLGELK